MQGAITGENTQKTQLGESCFSPFQEFTFCVFIGRFVDCRRVSASETPTTWPSDVVMLASVVLVLSRILKMNQEVLPSLKPAVLPPR